MKFSARDKHHQSASKAGALLLFSPLIGPKKTKFYSKICKAPPPRDLLGEAGVVRLNLGAGLPVPVLHKESDRERGREGLRRQECVCERQEDGAPRETEREAGEKFFWTPIQLNHAPPYKYCTAVRLGLDKKIDISQRLKRAGTGGGGRWGCLVCMSLYYPLSRAPSTPCPQRGRGPSRWPPPWRRKPWQLDEGTPHNAQKHQHSVLMSEFNIFFMPHIVCEEGERELLTLAQKKKQTRKAE